ncbi:MAG: PQQ-dependent sugar dehydrogenase [Flavobacteriales bacterium]
MNVRILLPGMFLFAAVASAQNPTRIELVPWATGLLHVTDIAHCGDERLFAVRQDGYISIVTDSMVVLPTPFLDIHDSVLYSGEQGMLGLAFDPDYATNGWFYVNYISATGGTHSRISRFTVTADPNVADPASEQIIYSVQQPYVNHKGGDLDFGPDGFLYVPFGDGGGWGDPEGHAQNLSDPLGDIIRIDVSGGGSGYVVPPSNPYVNAGPDTLPEIWASGLRNPFRFGFDRLTGDLWIGDVGQSAWEEIDHWPAGDNSGPNFGWHCYEGQAPFNTDSCDAIGAYVAPVTVHVNDGNLGQWCAIIGGRVYRGAQWPHLFGRYLYTDYCLGDFWSLKAIAPGQWFDEAVLDTTYGWNCIAENVHGELFTGHLDQGVICKIIDHCPMEPPVITYDGTLISTPANGYQWYLDGLPIPDAVQESHVPQANGVYHVVADYGEGCTLASDTLVLLNMGISNLEAADIAITPDPVDDHVAVSWNGGATVKEIRITDLQGRIVLQHAVRTGTRAELNTSQLATGVHFMQLRSADRSLITRRFVVMH